MNYETKESGDSPSTDGRGISGSPEIPGSDLGRRFLGRDDAAVHAVQERVRRIVAYRGYRISPEDRRDVEQDVMSQIWQAVQRPGFDLDRGLWGFAEVVASRRCIDWLRTNSRLVPLDPVAADPRANPLENALTEERSRLALSVLARLKEPCRELIRLHAALNKSYREIGEMLGKSEAALRVQMYRCIKRAREILLETTGAGGLRPVGPEGL